MEHKISVSQDKSIKIVEAINGREDKPFDFWRVLFEGAIAGGVTGVVETALYPIDTIKTRLQAGSSWWWENYFERTLFWLGRKSCWCLLPPQTRHLLLVVAMLLPLAPLQFRESFWNLEMLYDMAQQSLKDMVAENAIFVGVYELTKQKLLKSFPDNLSALAHLTAVAVGGASSSIVRVPTRMQTGKFSSAPDAIRLIVAKEGFKGLYDGCEHPPSVKRYGSFLLRDLPFDAIQFCIYEQLQVGYKLAARRDLKDPENAIIVAFAGAITGAITTPLDVIKTRLMLQVSANQYNGIIDCVRTIIIREEGTPALLKGIGPRVLWIGIGGLIFFRVLERTKKITAQRRPLGQNSTSFKSD